MRHKNNGRSVEFQRYLDKLPADERNAVISAESQYLDTHVLRILDEEQVLGEQMEGFSDGHGSSRAPRAVSDPKYRRSLV